MIGAVAGFKQQNAASGLPLRLLPEELALALDRGWVRGYRLRGEGEGECSDDGGGEARKRLLAAAAADPFLGDAAAGGGGGGEEDGGDGGSGDGGSGDGGSKRKEKDPSSSSSASCWREALERGTHLTLATAAPESLRVYFDSSAASASSSGPDEKRHNKNPMLKRRPRPGSRAAASHAVFRDLHSRGYCLTPGANFGAHWLAYPSDPMLYHAQLCVRVCSGAAEEEEEEEGEEEEESQSERRKGSSSSSSSSAAASTPLCPTLLAAASRGAHAARKHLLLAYPSNGTEGEEPAVVHYLTIAPEAGFG